MLKRVGLRLRNHAHSKDEKICCRNEKYILNIIESPLDIFFKFKLRRRQTLMRMKYVWNSLYNNFCLKLYTLQLPTIFIVRFCIHVIVWNLSWILYHANPIKFYISKGQLLCPYFQRTYVMFINIAKQVALMSIQDVTGCKSVCYIQL